MNSRLFPICPKFFAQAVKPLIYAHYKRPGRPPQGGHYQFSPLSSMLLGQASAGETYHPVLDHGTQFTPALSAGVKMNFFERCCINCSKEKNSPLI